MATSADAATRAAEFSVPSNPGWAKRFSEKHGSLDGECQAISPAAIDTAQRLTLRAKLAQIVAPAEPSATEDEVELTAA